MAQGICGAPLVPLSQAILLDAFPRNRAGQALAIFGLGIMVAPVIGPTLGGYLDRDLFLAHGVLHQRADRPVCRCCMSIGYLPQRAIKDIKTDWVGMVLLVLAVGALQFVLDQGQTRDWFNSRVIVVGAIIAVFASAAFFLRGWNKPDNIIDLSLLQGPQFRRRHAGHHRLRHQPVRLDGADAAVHPAPARLSAAMTPARCSSRAPSSAPSRSPITGSILIRCSITRYLVAAGLVLTAVGTLLMAHFSLYVDYWGIATPGIWSRHRHRAVLRAAHRRGFRQHLRKDKLDEASGVYALMRGIGGSAGIAVVSWLFVRQTPDPFRRAHGAYHAV